MINIAICDDEIHMSDSIKELATSFFQKKNIEISVCQFCGGKELLAYAGTVDILFLDIQMAGTDGMETARKLRSHGFQGFLIFVTVLQEMVFQSFEVQAFDYLVKPLRAQQFEKTMERLYQSMGNAGKTRLLVRKGNESSIVFFDDIIYCEVIDRKVYLHLKTSAVVDYYEKIERLQEILGKRFYRCHRSYLINLKYLKSYRNGTAFLEGGKEVPVSRLRAKEFSEVILQYMKAWRG